MKPRTFISCAIVMCLMCVEARAQGFSDDFNIPVLNSGWSWVREHRPFWSLTGTELQITTERGALNGLSYNNVQNILLQPAPTENFRIETKLNFSPDSILQNAGLIYYITDDNYIRVSRGIWADTSQYVNGVWLEWELNGLPDFVFVTPVPVSDVWFRLYRIGTSYRALYSLDGIAYTEIGVQAVPFPAGTPRVGVQAANGDMILASSDNIPARFDYFNVALVSSVNDPSTADAAVLLDIYPNPVQRNGTLTVQAPAGGLPYSIVITDVLGREVLHRDEMPGSFNRSIELDMSGLGSGTYLLRMQIGTRFSVRPIVITR